ncbi:MAG: DUF3108 domain-containing protein [Proteobacteria bacterium]|nr:DUF3108 domain-containing protein [Pseudomonadota bacterium]
MKHSRRRFLQLMAIMTGSFLIPRPGIPAIWAANSEKRPLGSGKKGLHLSPLTSIDYFLKEKVEYDISFLWFKKAAFGTLTFEREGDGYKAVLQAETKGFVGFFTSYRKHTYISHISYSPEMGKFRARRFERYVTIKEKQEKTITDLDYKTRTMNWKDYKDGILKEDKSEPMSGEHDHEDVLSAFYNFRMGVFGPIKRDREFKVNTIPEKGVSTIDVKIGSLAEAYGSKRLFGKGFKKEMFHIKVRVPKEIFKSRHGVVDIWVDEQIIPIRGVVKDYIGFGDIRGTLKRG